MKIVSALALMLLAACGAWMPETPVEVIGPLVEVSVDTVGVIAADGREVSLDGLREIFVLLKADGGAVD